MIETIVMDYLEGTLSVPVYAEVPKDAPASFVVVEKTSSAISDRVYSHTVAIQSYAGTMYSAAALNESVKSAMDGIKSLSSISKCSLESDYNFTDTSTRRYRYQAIFAIVSF